MAKGNTAEHLVQTVSVATPRKKPHAKHPGVPTGHSPFEDANIKSLKKVSIITVRPSRF